LAGVLTGASVSDIVILSLNPHVRILGDATGPAEAVRAAAGSGFVVLLFFTLLSDPIVKRTPQILKVIAFWFVIAELLGWTLSAVSPTATGPNDAAHFMDATGIGGFAIAIVCVAVGAVAAAGMCARARVHEAYESVCDSSTDPIIVS
jgi:hypothetical protein